MQMNHPARTVSSSVRRPVLLALLALLFFVALALRMVQLMDAPQFTDEVLSIGLANEISRGRVFPLTNQPSTYYGPLYVYLLAGFFWIAGHSFYTARLLVAMLGALLPLAVFWVTSIAQGDEHRGDLRAPLFAAALAITSPTLVAIDSHIFWPTSLAPLMFALMLGSYMLGLRQGSEKWLLGSGLFVALLMYSAPQAVAALPGLVLHFLSDSSRRARLSRPRAYPFPYLGAAVAVLAYLPLILYNLLTGFQSVTSAVQLTSGYAFQVVGSAGEYLQNIRELVSLFVRVVGGNMSVAIPTFEYFQIGFSLVLLAGGAWYSLKGRAAPCLWLILSTTLLMPVFNKAYYAGFPIQNRYLATLLPACFCIMALFAFNKLQPGLVLLSSRLVNELPFSPSRGSALLVYSALALLVLLPVASTLNYYSAVKTDKPTNSEVIVMLEVLERQQPPPSVVALNPAWETIKVGPGNNLLLTAQTWLELKGRRYSLGGE